jgi:hypothetical protein
MALSIADPRLPTLFGFLAALLLIASATITGLPGLSWGALRRSLRSVPRGFGLAAGVVAAGSVMVASQALGLRGLMRIWAFLIALLIGLLLGVYLPGLEARQHAARRKRLQLQTIDFTGYMLLALSGPYGDVAILREYTRRPRRNVRDLQNLIAIVLEAHQRAGRGSVLDQLHRAAQESGCIPLIDITAAMRQVMQHDRAQVASALAEQRKQLIEATIAAYKQRAQRLEFVMLGVTASALFFGLLAFILYVMTGGGSLIRLS